MGPILEMFGICHVSSGGRTKFTKLIHRNLGVCGLRADSDEFVQVRIHVNILFPVTIHPTREFKSEW